MAAPGHTTPLREATFQNLQLNAGIFLKNFTYSSLANATAVKTAIATAISGGSILGATRGGGTFTVTVERRVPEADGRRYGYKGDTFVDSVDAKLSATLIEITKENLCLALGATNVTSASNKHTIQMKTAISTTDYLTNICWVGDLSNGGMVLICLKNTINEADLTLTFTDKGEGTLPVEFHAKQAGVTDYDYAPFEVVIFPAGS